MQPNRPDELARIQAAGGRVVFNNGHRVRGILAMSRALGMLHLQAVTMTVLCELSEFPMPDDVVWLFLVLICLKPDSDATVRSTCCTYTCCLNSLLVPVTGVVSALICLRRWTLTPPCPCAARVLAPRVSIRSEVVDGTFPWDLSCHCIFFTTF
jgi:hypothetical protein